MKRINFRISDSVRKSLDQLVDDLQRDGADASISEVARLVMAEGLRSMRERGEDTSAMKGARFERWVLKRLQDTMPAWEFEQLKPRQGQHNPDIRGPFCVYECKTGKRPSARGALEQAITSDRDGLEPVAVIRDDGGEAFVVLPFDVFLRFLKGFGMLAGLARSMNERGGE